MRSPLWAGLSDANRERLYAETGTKLLVGRVGEVEEIARAYLFCLTQTFATGTIVTVDGGTVLV